MVINAVRTVFAAVRNKLRKTIINLAVINYGASDLLPQYITVVYFSPSPAIITVITNCSLITSTTINAVSILQKYTINTAEYFIIPDQISSTEQHTSIENHYDQSLIWLSIGLTKSALHRQHLNQFLGLTLQHQYPQLQYMSPCRRLVSNLLLNFWQTHILPCHKILPEYPSQTVRVSPSQASTF